MKTGVYQIRNLKNSKRYIGSASASGGIDGRWSDHRSELRRGIHANQKLQRAWNKYGEASFVFEILEPCEAAQCIKREQYYLDTLLFASENDSRFSELGYNICRIANSSFGIKRSGETCRRISEAKKGLPSWNKGKQLSLAHRTNLSKSHAGKILSEEHRQRIKNSHARLCGEKHGAHRLRLKDVVEIKQLLMDGFAQNEIAKMYNVHPVTIHDIKHEKTWRDA